MKVAATGRRVEFGRGIDQAAADDIVRRVVANPIIERWAFGLIEPDLTSGGRSDGSAATVAHPRIGTRRARAGRGRSGARSRPRRTAGRPTPLRRRADAIRPTSSSRPWPRPGASTAPTRRSGRTIVTDDGAANVDRCSPTARLHRRDRRPVRAVAFVGNAGIDRVHRPGTTDRPQGRDPQPPVGGRAVRRCQHRRRRRDPRRAGRRPPPDRRHRHLVLRAPRPPAGRRPRRRAPPAADPRRASSTASPTTATRSACPPSPARSSTTRPTPPTRSCSPAASASPTIAPRCTPARTPATASSCSAAAPAATASAARRSRRATMDATTGEVAGASVQIGDPIVEKLLIDVLVGAEDLYTAITDCGAGGLSSAIGEMAEGVGADVDLDLVPLQVRRASSRGRSGSSRPRNAWSSPSRPQHLGAAHASVLRSHGVERRRHRLVHRRRPTASCATAATTVLDLDTALPPRRAAATPHDARRCRHRTAPTCRPAAPSPTPPPPCSRCSRIRNIASKAATIHRYDHEILGATVVRPLVGAAGDGPADGVVLAAPSRHRRHRDRHRRQPVVRPPRPRGDGLRRGRRGHPQRRRRRRRPRPGGAARQLLVGRPPAAVDARRTGRRRSTGAAALPHAHRAPFVSGKDSLNNEYLGTDGAASRRATHAGDHRDRPRARRRPLRHARPGRARQRRCSWSATTRSEFAGSHLDMVLRRTGRAGAVPAPDPDAPAATAGSTRPSAPGSVESCHDVSEGGLAVALAEMCIAGRLGATIDTLPHADLADRAVQRVERSARRRGRARRRRPRSPRSMRRTGPSCSAPSPTSRLLRSPASQPIAARRTRRRVPRAEVDAMSRPGHSCSPAPAPTATTTSALALDLAGAEPRIVLADELIARPDAARRRADSPSSPAASATPTHSAPAACWRSTSTRRARRRARARSSPPASP